VHKRAKNVCREERSECRETCIAELDPACVEECRDEAELYREDLGMCLNDCGQDARTDANECRMIEGDLCNPKEVRDCLRGARGDAYRCTDACHDETACGEELHSCLRECRFDE
jgi:hypothetical protein